MSWLTVMSGAGASLAVAALASAGSPAGDCTQALAEAARHTAAKLGHRLRFDMQEPLANDSRELSALQVGTVPAVGRRRQREVVVDDRITRLALAVLVLR